MAAARAAAALAGAVTIAAAFAAAAAWTCHCSWAIYPGAACCPADGLRTTLVPATTAFVSPALTVATAAAAALAVSSINNWTVIAAGANTTWCTQRPVLIRPAKQKSMGQGGVTDWLISGDFSR